MAVASSTIGRGTDNHIIIRVDHKRSDQSIPKEFNSTEHEYIEL